MLMDLNSSILVLGKLFFLFGFGTYVIFAIVIVRQVYLMTTTLQVGFETPVRMLGWIHLIVAIGVFLFVLLFL